MSPRETFALRQVNIPVSEQEQQFENFQQWIEQKFNQSSTQHWTKIILFYAEDEPDALEIFFELFEEFINQKQTIKTANNFSSYSYPVKK